MSTSKDDPQQKGFTCDRIETASTVDDMPGHNLIEAERQLPVFENTKKHWRVLLIACVSFSAATLYGFDMIINGASISMPSFMLYFGEMGPDGPYLPSIWTSLWTAMASLTQAVGSILVGTISDKYGRKWPACCASIVTMVGTAVQFTAHSRGQLMGGKMVAGFGIGATLAMGITYLAEISPVKLRAPLQSCLIVFIVTIQGLALGWAVGGLALVAWILAPESPLWLIRKQKIDRARKVMQLLYGSNDAEERLAREIHIVRIENENASLSPEITWMSCFRGTDSTRTATTALLFSLTNLAGAAFLSQNIYFLITAGLEAVHSFDIGIGGFAFAAILIASSGLYLQRISRRNMIIGGLIFNLVFMIIIGALYFAPGRGAIWAIAILMNVLISFQAAILQGVGWAVAAEVPTPSLRAKTLSLGLCGQTLTTWLFQFVTPYMYNVDSGRLGSRVGFVHAGITILVLVGAWFLVPDTTNMTTQEIDEAYHNGVSPRNFRSYLEERDAQEGGALDKTV
ncbi:hypothetical protein MBLNU13_g10880t1 [Cladosporium sp. NU13]